MHQTLVGKLHFGVTATVCHNAISEYLRIDQIQCIIMIYTFDLHWHRFQGQKLLFSAKFAYCQQKACRSCSNIALTRMPLRRPLGPEQSYRNNLPEQIISNLKRFNAKNVKLGPFDFLEVCAHTIVRQKDPFKCVLICFFF